MAVVVAAVAVVVAVFAASAVASSVAVGVSADLLAVSDGVPGCIVAHRPVAIAAGLACIAQWLPSAGSSFVVRRGGLAAV